MHPYFLFKYPLSRIAHIEATYTPPYLSILTSLTTHKITSNQILPRTSYRDSGIPRNDNTHDIPYVTPTK